MPFPISLKFEAKTGKSGKRKTKIVSSRGRFIKAKPMDNSNGNIAFAATIRRAAIRCFQENLLNIEKHDLMKKHLTGKAGSSILFVVDASGSMGVEELMKNTKNLLLGLLHDAYQKRERTGMIVFRGTKANTVLPFTKSISVAKSCLKEIKTGGKTPLSSAIKKAIEELIIEKKKHKNNEQIVLFFTDGRANISLTEQDPFEEAVAYAKKLSSLKCKIFVIDTDPTWISYPYAKDLAHQICARYYKLTDILNKDIRRLIYI